jgi:curved DNA-binding protein CbpA
MINYYAILGIPLFSDPAKAKQAYKALAKRYHPDKNPGDEQAEEQFKRISHAYQVLSNPEQKHRYDMLLRTYHKAGNLKERYARKRTRSFVFNSYSSSSSSYHHIVHGVASIGLMLVICATIWLFGEFNMLLHEKKSNQSRLNTGLVAENTRILLWEEKYEKALQGLEENKHYISNDTFAILKQSILAQLQKEARHAMQQEQYQTAQQFLTLVLKYNETPPMSDQLMLAQSYIHLEEYTQAVNLYLRMAQITPQNAAYAYFQIGKIYFLHLKTTDRAEKYLELSWEKNPTSEQVNLTDSVIRYRQLLHYYLSSCYLRTGKPQQLIDHLAHVDLQNQQVETLQNLVVAYCETGQKEKACQLQLELLNKKTHNSSSSNSNCCQ